MTTPYTVVPAAFRLPLMRPKRVPGVDYEQAMRDYLAEVDRRFATVTPDASTQEANTVEDEDEDEDGDEYLSDGGTTLDFEDEDEDEDEYEYLSDGKYQENPMHAPKVSRERRTPAELQEKMSDACCFCLEDLTRAQAVTTDCHHSFCETCFQNYQKTTCPCCRQKFRELTTYYSDS